MGKALLTVLAIVMLVLVLMLVHAQLIVMGKVRPGVSPALAKHSLALLASLGHPSASHMLASMRSSDRVIRMNVSSVSRHFSKS